MPEPPQGRIGTPEAADLIGVHQQTIRNWVNDGKLEGFKEYDSDSKQLRYWITRESVDALVAEKAVEPERVEVADQLARRTEDILVRIADQEHSVHKLLREINENLDTRLNRVEERQIRVVKNITRAVDILEELGDRSRQFQDKMLEMLEEEREYLRKQREELGHEERRGRGFWQRLFGSGQSLC